VSFSQFHKTDSHIAREKRWALPSVLPGIVKQRVLVGNKTELPPTSQKRFKAAGGLGGGQEEVFQKLLGPGQCWKCLKQGGTPQKFLLRILMVIDHSLELILMNY
jgi:hypothetical protein